MEAALHGYKENRCSFTSLISTQKTKREAVVNKEELAVFDTLYQQYYPGVLAYFRFRVGNKDVIEDLTSRVFELAFVHISDLKSRDAAATWIFRIAKNCAHDYFRRQRPEISLEKLVVAECPRACSSEEQVLADEERRNLLAQVSRLSEREQEIIGLKFVAHLTNRQIGHILNMPEGTVGSLLYRTLGKLRDALSTEREIV